MMKVIEHHLSRIRSPEHAGKNENVKRKHEANQVPATQIGYNSPCPLLLGDSKLPIDDQFEGGEGTRVCLGSGVDKGKRKIVGQGGGWGTMGQALSRLGSYLPRELCVALGIQRG